MNTKYLHEISDVSQLSLHERRDLKQVTNKYPFHASEYYLSLIDWSNEQDPLRKALIPQAEELAEWGSLDASEESRYTIMPGLQHKYDSTALMLVSGSCGGICRYCFRKRIFMQNRADILEDIPGAINYIRDHKEITSVLLSGGDPLRLATSTLEDILGQLWGIDHLQTVRIGTRMLSFDPFRILNDPDLLNMIGRYGSSIRKGLYVMTHFVHPRELNEHAERAVTLLRKAGAVLSNQFPLVRGINDDPRTLADLFEKLSIVGVPPYYVFQCRPASGNAPFAVPVEEGYSLIEAAKRRVSGLAKRARYVMSHRSGKIEVVGHSGEFVYFKYHSVPRGEANGRFLVFRSNPYAYWLDDYAEMAAGNEVVAL